MKKHTQTIWYRVLEHGEDAYYPCRIAGPYVITDPYDQASMACECAIMYFRQHDVWESTWPLTFTLHTDEGGPEFASLLVEMEVIPKFSSPQFVAQHAGRVVD